MRSSTALVGLILALHGVGCSKPDKPTAPAPGTGPTAGPKEDKKAPPEPLTYTRVKSDLASNTGKPVVWRGKLVRRLEKDDGTLTMYYLLLAENPDRAGDFAGSRPFLVDRQHATVGKSVVVEKKGGQILYGPGDLRWAAIPCEEAVLVVSGTVKGELAFNSDIDGLPKTAPLLAPADLRPAAEK